MAKTVLIKFVVSPDLHERMKRLAALKGLGIDTFTSQAMEAFVQHSERHLGDRLKQPAVQA